MRILYHHRTLGIGAEGIHVREMVRALRTLGHEVRVVALIGEQAGERKDRQRVWKHIREYIPEALYEVAEVAYNVVSRRALTRTIDEFQPHVVYDRYNTYSSSAVDAALRAELPVIVEVNAPVVYERTNYEYLQLRLPWLARHYERAIFARATHLLAVSSPLKHFIVDSYSIDSRKVSVLPNGVDPIKFEPRGDLAALRQELSLPAGPLIGFVGAARPWHGLELLVRAFALVGSAAADARLLFVGGGPSTGEIRQLVAALGLEGRVVFVDQVEYAQVPKYVAAMDIAVSPRATFYASPLKLVEYMSMSKAIVAPEMANIQDLVRHEESALLFEPENVTSLAHALNRLVVDEELRSRLGRAARRDVEERHNWSAKAGEVLRICAEVARAPGA